MLFFFITTTNKIYASHNRVVLVFLSVLFICCILPSLTNAYPTSMNLIDENANLRMNQINQDMSIDLQRHERGTGYYIIRQGDYVVLIPDSKHHFTKNIRPYIGR